MLESQTPRKGSGWIGTVKKRKGRKAKRKDLKRITQLERKKRKKATRTGDENVRKSENLFPICVRQGCC